MTANYKLLAQTSPTANTETLNYAVPTSTSTVVRSINITNTSSVSDKYYIAIVSASGASATNKDYISYNNVIQGNSTISIKAGYTIQASGGIRIKSTNGTCTFSTYGAELT
jgi:hypothetical protein